MEISTRKKIALFGGTFDPFHIGHLELLQNLYDEIKPDKIIIVPTGHPYMKEVQGRKITCAGDRVGMLKAGLKYACFPWEISMFEVEKDSPSYSVETVEYLRQNLDEPENSDIYFLCGSDVLFEIDKWYEFKKLISGIILTVIPRGSDDIDAIKKRKKQLEDEYGAKIIISDFRGEDISSSAIRDNIEAGEKLLPAGTYEYIREHHLWEV